MYIHPLNKLVSRWRCVICLRLDSGRKAPQNLGSRTNSIDEWQLWVCCKDTGENGGGEVRSVKEECCAAGLAKPSQATQSKILHIFLVCFWPTGSKFRLEHALSRTRSFLDRLPLPPHRRLLPWSILDGRAASKLPMAKEIQLPTMYTPNSLISHLWQPKCT